MPLSAAPNGQPTSVSIHPYSPEVFGGCTTTVVSGTAPASAIWPVANLSIMYPFSVTTPWTAKTMFVYNGATASGNLDLGIYDDAGTLLVAKGSTAQAGTSVLQLVDITDTVLLPGRRYYMALSMDGIVATTFSIAPTVVGQVEAVGIVGAATNFPLATTTFVAPTQLYLPFFGASTLTVY